MVNGMTDYQFKSVIKMILKIVQESTNKDEIIQYLKELLDNQEQK